MTEADLGVRRGEWGGVTRAERVRERILQFLRELKTDSVVGGRLPVVAESGALGEPWFSVGEDESISIALLGDEVEGGEESGLGLVIRSDSDDEGSKVSVTVLFGVIEESGEDRTVGFSNDLRLVTFRRDGSVLLNSSQGYCLVDHLGVSDFDGKVEGGQVWF